MKFPYWLTPYLDENSRIWRRDEWCYFVFDPDVNGEPRTRRIEYDVMTGVGYVAQEIKGNV